MLASVAQGQGGTALDLGPTRGGDGELAKELERLGPSRDGWESEVLAARVGILGEAMGEWILGGGESPAEFRPSISCSLPKGLGPWTPAGVFELARAQPNESLGPEPLSGSMLRERLGRLFLAVPDLQFGHVKVTGIHSSQAGAWAQLRFDWVNPQGTGQAICEMRIFLGLESDEIQVAGVEVISLDLARRGGDGPLMVDIGVAWIADGAVREQLGLSMADLRRGLDSRLGVGLLGHHGLALGDIDRDGLEDIYVCQPGGMPNLLLMRDAKGQFHDRAKEYGLDFCDPSRSALLLDFDGDGWQDLVLAAGAELLFFQRQPGAAFVLKTRASAGHLTSIVAGDWDGDQDLDIFACGYLSPYEGSQVPLPYENATNGAANFLFSNQGDFKFLDVTDRVGLSKDNRRFTFAASFWDYDEDGDQDLLVVNDFGANQLWRNDGGRFVDVAEALGVADVAAGMGCALGDVNGDGHEDIFISNMFSAAGNRIAGQDQFRPGKEPLEESLFKRHAQGNSLFLGQGASPMIEVPGAGGAQMGRWAWGGIFCDFDLDGTQDIYVPAGFVTGQRDDDL